jgi:hypothetical protein
VWLRLIGCPIWELAKVVGVEPTGYRFGDEAAPGAHRLVAGMGFEPTTSWL